jgi:hypothetical protein
LFGFTAAQLAQKLLFRFKRPASELPLVTVIADFVRTAMASIAIGDSGVRSRCATEPKQDPKRQRELPKRVKKSRHKKLYFYFIGFIHTRKKLPNPIL